MLYRRRVDIGLILSLASTLFSLPLNKRYHAALGVCFTLLAIFHTWQHRRLLVPYLQKERQAMGLMNWPPNKQSEISNKMAYFLQHVQVLHYIPGRVRLFSRLLVNNAAVAAQVSSQLETIGEISSFSINPATGSVLIQYLPEKVAQNPLLMELEQFAAKQMGR